MVLAQRYCMYTDDRSEGAMTTGKIGALFQRLTVLIWDVPAAKNIQPVLHDCLIEILSLFAHYWHPRRGVRMQRADLVGPSINA